MCTHPNHKGTKGAKALYVGRTQKKSEREQILRHKFEEWRKEQISKCQGSNVYVKNIDDDVTENKLQECFSECGTITSAKLMKVEWTYELKRKATWTLKINEPEFDFGTDMWSACLEEEIGVFSLFVKIKVPHPLSFINCVNKKGSLSQIQRANWSCKLKLKAEFESWTPKITDVKFELGIDIWSVSFNADFGVFLFISEGEVSIYVKVFVSTG
ncbi:polyadenylate-binding protein 7 [Tanacetum coccineum]